LNQVKFWAYQIQNHYLNPQAIADSHYDLVVIDQARSVSDMTDYDDAALVATLQASANHLGGNKLVLAYIDVGQAEDYRWYWQSGWGIGNPSFVAGADPDGWAGNYPVVFWDPAWKAIVFEYLDRIIADGFDGIYMDWLEAYEYQAVIDAAAAQGKNAELEMVQFVSEISQHAKSQKPGFLIVGQNASPLGAHAAYLAAIDGQAQEDLWFGGDPNGAPGDYPQDPSYTQELQSNLAVFLAAGKPVFSCNYATAPANVSFCYAESATLGYVEYVTTVELDQLTSTPPPGY
jgi:cysteinyl-tRNA synthetase